MTQKHRYKPCRWRNATGVHRWHNANSEAITKFCYRWRKAPDLKETRNRVLTWIIFVFLYKFCSLLWYFLHKGAQHPLPILNPDWTDAKRNTIWSCAIYSKILFDLASFFFFARSDLPWCMPKKNWKVMKSRITVQKSRVLYQQMAQAHEGPVVLSHLLGCFFFLKKMAYRWRISKMCAKYFEIGVPLSWCIWSIR